MDVIKLIMEIVYQGVEMYNLCLLLLSEQFGSLLLVVACITDKT